MAAPDALRASNIMVLFGHEASLKYRACVTLGHIGFVITLSDCIAVEAGKLRCRAYAGLTGKSTVNEESPHAYRGTADAALDFTRFYGKGCSSIKCLASPSLRGEAVVRFR